MASKRTYPTFAAFIDFSDQTTVMVYRGPSEYKAILAFYRAIVAAAHDSRIDQVVMHRDLKPVASVRVRSTVSA